METVEVNAVYATIPLSGVPKRHATHATAKIEHQFIREVEVLSDKMFVNVQMTGIVVQEICFGIANAFFEFYGW
jgi:hypothetical protein